MKKKSLLLLFLVACFLVCLIPSLGMIMFKSDETVGNEQVTEFPSFVTEDNKFNQDVFEQMGTYFEKHFAFRPMVISVDAQIQSQVFGVSNLDSVIVGKDGWLYYSSTLNDYLGKNTMSEREVDNISHNLKLTQDYVNAQGAEFLFTVAPNKNSLYPEYMPYYYSKKASDIKNIDLLVPKLSKYGINYCDLFSVFENENEVLYLKQDSHWNNKGALLSYNKILDDLKKPHDTFEDAQVTRTKTFMGDLGKMLYPKTQESEYNYNYGAEQNYTYITPTKSVEDATISTKCHSGDGSLYMYRDSFGNSLLPFFANAFENAYFTKGFPPNLALHMTSQKPDTVIFEIVERNLNWFAENPPVFTNPQLTLYNIADTMNCTVDIKGEISPINMTYMQISGVLPEDAIKGGCDIFVELIDKNGTKHLYEAFHTCTEDSDYGFLVYAPSQDFINDAGDTVVASIVTKVDSSYYKIGSANVTINEPQI